MKRSGKIGAAILVCITRPLSILPLGFHHRAGHFIGRLAGKVLKYRRDVVMTNLSRSFPEKKYSELSDICDKFYTQLGCLLAEAIWFGASRNPERLRKAGIVHITNPEVVNDYFDAGKSVFVMASHNGNWEIYAGLKTYSTVEPLHVPENDIVVIYKKLSSPAWDRFMFANRLTPIVDKKHYDGLVETYDIMRYAFNHRKTPKLYNFITDQYPYTISSKVKVSKDFLNQETYTMDGAAALAKLFGMPVVYMNMKIESEGHYTLTYTKICENAAECEVQDIIDKYYEQLEKDVREQPWNYLWTHKRWK